MNYEVIYNNLYKVGYHAKGKNHGVELAKWLVDNYDFFRILDVGCSNGLAVRVFHKARRKGYGIDIAQIAINYATEKFGVRNCIEGSALDIPFKTNYFDAVFSCDMLEHLQPADVETAIKEIIRVSKVYLFLKISDKLEENREALEMAKVKCAGFKDINNLHLTVMSYNQWIHLIESHGVKLLANHNGLLIFKHEN